MKVKLIKFEGFRAPERAHYNDAGADVFAAADAWVPAYGVAKVPLGFGIELPDGFQANVYPRSGLTVKGLIAQLPPIDSGYRGEIHAIVINMSKEGRYVKEGTKIGQLVITPIVLADFVESIDETPRGGKGFGSTDVQ